MAREFHKPTRFEPHRFDGVMGAEDPARLRAIAHETAQALVDASAGQLLAGVSVTPVSAGDTVSVTITATVVKVLPVFPTFHVSATSAAPIERFRPQEPALP